VKLLGDWKLHRGEITLILKRERKPGGLWERGASLLKKKRGPRGVQKDFPIATWKEKMGVSWLALGPQGRNSSGRYFQLPSPEGTI